MYYIDRITMADATFLAGSLAEPAAGETAWSAGAHSVGDVRIRPALHRTFRCAVAVAGPGTTPPEDDPDHWQDWKPTQRWLPFGPSTRADGRSVYHALALESTSADITYVLSARFANAVALFGLRGTTWSVQVHDEPGGTLVQSRTGAIQEPAYGFWDYCFGKRRVRDRVIVTGLPIYPNAQITITITAGASALRRVSQIEVGALRSVFGTVGPLKPGRIRSGLQRGIEREPRAYLYRQDDPDGTAQILIYGTTVNLSGALIVDGFNEDAALRQYRDLLGRGVAYIPSLAPSMEQSAVFGVLTSAPTTRESLRLAQTRFEIEGLPTS